MPLQNPAEDLVPIITQLYQLSSTAGLPEAQRQSLLLQAHDLRGDLVGLVALQFTQNTPAYQSAMNNLNQVTTALNQAKQDVAKALAIIDGVGQLAASLDGLLKEAMAVGGTVAKFG